MPGRARPKDLLISHVYMTDATQSKPVAARSVIGLIKERYPIVNIKIVFAAALACFAASSAQTPAAAASTASTACKDTTTAAHTACRRQNASDYWIDKGKCFNEKEQADLMECLADANESLAENDELCNDQRLVRGELCDALGPGPYDPRFERRDFVNPTEIGNSIAPNPFFPLLPGRTLVYRSSEEKVRVTFTNKVKVIDNVPCLVVLDTVEVDGEVAEDTIDWFAQDIYGNVWYCGEATAEYEDDFPVSTDGSFQADVEGARPGIIMKAAPVVGDVYRQEFDLGNAEDAAEVTSLTGSATATAASCSKTCLVTREFTPLEPDAAEFKYYKPGVGFILQTAPGSNVRLQLIQIIDN